MCRLLLSCSAGLLISACISTRHKNGMYIRTREAVTRLCNPGVVSHVVCSYGAHVMCAPAVMLFVDVDQFRASSLNRTFPPSAICRSSTLWLARTASTWRRRRLLSRPLGEESLSPAMCCSQKPTISCQINLVVGYSCFEVMEKQPAVLLGVTGAFDGLGLNYKYFFCLSTRSFFSTIFWH